jgi:hypothetical protein
VLLLRQLPQTSKFNLWVEPNVLDDKNSYIYYFKISFVDIFYLQSINPFPSFAIIYPHLRDLQAQRSRLLGVFSTLTIPA